MQSSDRLQKIHGTSLLVFITNKNNNDNDDNTIDTFVVDFNFCWKFWTPVKVEFGNVQVVPRYSAHSVALSYVRCWFHSSDR